MITKKQNTLRIKMKNKNQFIIYALSLFLLIGTTSAQQENKPLNYKVREHIEAGAQPPVLFLLHGYGGNKSQFKDAMKVIDRRFLIVSINAPYGNFFRLSNWWYEFAISNGDTTSNQIQVEYSISRLLATMDAIQNKYKFDNERIYIGGYSQGAILSYKLALLYPEKFSGAVVHSARLPVKYSIKTSTAPYEGLDMLIIHGKNDAVLTTKWATQGVNLFKRLGADVEYYEGDFGHERTEKSILQMSRWLKERIDEN